MYLNIASIDIIYVFPTYYFDKWSNKVDENVSYKGYIMRT